MKLSLIYLLNLPRTKDKNQSHFIRFTYQRPGNTTCFPHHTWGALEPGPRGWEMEPSWLGRTCAFLSHLEFRQISNVRLPLRANKMSRREKKLQTTTTLRRFLSCRFRFLLFSLKEDFKQRLGAHPGSRAQTGPRPQQRGELQLCRPEEGWSILMNKLLLNK